MLRLTCRLNETTTTKLQVSATTDYFGLAGTVSPFHPLQHGLRILQGKNKTKMTTTLHKTNSVAQGLLPLGWVYAVWIRGRFVSSFYYLHAIETNLVDTMCGKHKTLILCQTMEYTKTPHTEYNHLLTGPVAVVCRQFVPSPHPSRLVSPRRTPAYVINLQRILPICQ